MYLYIRIEKRLHSVKSISCNKKDTNPKQDSCYTKRDSVRFVAALNPHNVHTGWQALILVKCPSLAG